MKNYKFRTVWQTRDSGNSSSDRRKQMSLKYPEPIPEPECQGPWRFGVRRSRKRALRRVQLCRGNWDASLLVLKAALGTNEAASAFCGWLHQEQFDNQMAAQRDNRPESAKRHHTGKRMIYLLRCSDPFANTQPKSDRAGKSCAFRGIVKVQFLGWKRAANNNLLDFTKFFERKFKILRIVIE